MFKKFQKYKNPHQCFVHNETMEMEANAEQGMPFLIQMINELAAGENVESRITELYEVSKLHFKFLPRFTSIT